MMMKKMADPGDKCNESNNGKQNNMKWKTFNGVLY